MSLVYCWCLLFVNFQGKFRLENNSWPVRGSSNYWSHTAQKTWQQPAVRQGPSNTKNPNISKISLWTGYLYHNFWVQKIALANSLLPVPKKQMFLHSLHVVATTTSFTLWKTRYVLCSFTKVIYKIHQSYSGAAFWVIFSMKRVSRRKKNTVVFVTEDIVKDHNEDILRK